MAKIHVLSEHLTNMIAAGEVVERPAGIVKECVENSIDAGATVIEVEVFQGGIERIVITDDGCGMDHEDAHLAFMRHATSKMHQYYFQRIPLQFQLVFQQLLQLQSYLLNVHSKHES